MDIKNPIRRASFLQSIEIVGNYLGARKKMSPEDTRNMIEDASYFNPQSIKGNYLRFVCNVYSDLLEDQASTGELEKALQKAWMQWSNYIEQAEKKELDEEKRKDMILRPSYRYAQKLKSIGKVVLMIAVIVLGIIFSQGGGESWFTK